VPSRLPTHPSPFGTSTNAMPTPLVNVGGSKSRGAGGSPDPPAVVGSGPVNRPAVAEYAATASRTTSTAATAVITHRSRPDRCGRGMRDRSFSLEFASSCDWQSASRSATSRAERNRSSGRLACRRAMTSHSHRGVSGMISRTARGVSSATRLRTATVPFARNGGRPESIAYSTLPRLNGSARWSSGSPFACSGAMYMGGGPAISPLCDRLASSAARASPKSLIFTFCVPPSSSTLAGLMSRWIRSVAWAAASPSAICRPIRTTSSTSSGPVRSIRCCSVSPGMYSMAMYGSGRSPTSYTCTTFSCLTWADDRASRRNRLRAGEVAATCGESTFTATTRRRTSSNARKTMPNPPRPSTLSTS
jgi:hypothetical protein